MRLKIKLSFLLIFSTLFLNINQSSYALIGVEEAKKIQPKHLNNKQTDKKKNNKKNNNQKNDNQDITTMQKPSNVPDFPKDDGVEEYKMLFNDGFSNIVEDTFQTGEEWDVFINQTAGNQINELYIAGNDEEYTQMDALTAEKKAVIDHSLVDKNNITTHRTRIMAYLTLDQMLFNDLFGAKPHGYYVTAMTKRS